LPGASATARAAACAIWLLGPTTKFSKVYLGLSLGRSAAGAGKVNTMEVLISLGADVDALSDSDATPLHQAVLHNRPEAVKLLIRGNAELNSQNKSGYTPLDYATANGWTELVKLLQTAGAVSGKSL